MTQSFVADIGNTRIKYARADEHRLHEVVALPSSSPNTWAHGLSGLGCQPGSRWMVASVQPLVCQAFVERLREAGSTVRVLNNSRDVPIDTDLEFPELTGIDRLLAAFAAKCRVGPNIAAGIVSVGTAVTADLVDHRGIFRGGAILPGFRLMAQSVNQFTAQLPLVSEWESASDSPGRDTTAAIRAGIESAISGGVDRILESYRRQEPTLRVILTGGDANLLRLNAIVDHSEPHLVLEGLRRVALQHT